MELTDAIRRRHMTRNFSSRPLPAGLLDTLVSDALRAPSAGNTQGTDLVVLEGPEETGLYWRTATDEAWRATSRRFEGLSRAPAMVLPFVDPDAYVARYREADKARSDGSDIEWVVPFWFVDAAFLTMALLLRATSEGLGAAFLGNFRGEDQIKDALGVPGRFRWLGAVLLGEPARPDPPSASLARGRRTVGDAVHRGRW